MSLKITIIGLGYLGATTAIAFAKMGHQVIGIDSDQAKVDVLKSGLIPFYEPNLEEALTEVLANNSINFATEHDESSRDADLHLLCVGTPQAKFGAGADTSFLFSAIDSLLPYLGENSLVVGKSTVPVGTAAEIQKYLDEKLSFRVPVAWNPEFLREGTALQDSLTPDRVVIGVSDSYSEVLLRELYRPVTDLDIPLLTLDIPTSELVKVAANSFLATKISFINAMAEIAEIAGADAVKLAEAIGHDERIGNKFLRTGIGFGGGCLPKDIRAFQARAEELGVGEAVSFLADVEAINLRRRTRVLAIAQEELGDLTGIRVTVLGAAFKPETDDIRDSPAMAVAELFWQAGAVVTVHDPKALPNVRKIYPQLDTQDQLAAACANAELLVIATEWRDYRAIDPFWLGNVVQNRLVIDGRNVIDVDIWRSANWQIRALGRSLEPLPVLV